MELFLFLSSQSEQSHEEGQQSPGLIDSDNEFDGYRMMDDDDDFDDDDDDVDNVDLVIGQQQE